MGAHFWRQWLDHRRFCIADWSTPRCKFYENRLKPKKYAHQNYHRSLGSSGDLNDVLIDPAEDWSQALWSRDHFQTRELVFNRFPRQQFEIAAAGQSTRIWLASRESGFSKVHKKLIWTYHPIQFFLQNTVLDSESGQNQPKTRFWPIFEKNWFIMPNEIWAWNLQKSEISGRPLGDPKLHSKKSVLHGFRPILIGIKYV